MPDQEIKLETAKKSQKSKSKRTRGDAVTRLAKETARNVREKSTELSDALLKRALEGDVSCTKLLLLLIEKCPPKKHRYKSIAAELANAPQWQGPWPAAKRIDDDEEDPPVETAASVKTL